MSHKACREAELARDAISDGRAQRAETSRLRQRGDPPATGRRADLSVWFRNRRKEPAATRTGSWSKDLDAAFYVAVFLRAAQHSIRRGCPMVYS